MTQELRKLAEAATQGPWIAGDDEDSDYYLVGPPSFDRVVTNPVVQLHALNNAEFIAAANPAAILSLLDRLEKAEKDAERYRWLRDTGTQGFSNGTPQRGVTIAMDGSVKLHFVYWMTQQQLDKSIDEAMEAIK